MPVVQTTSLLRSTRRLTVLVVLLLSLQLSGNLYEQVVSNVGTIAAPRDRALVGELDPGSPLFFYLPWVPLGLVLAVVLSVRLHRLAPPAVARRSRTALGLLGAAAVAKALLISQVNPRLRIEGLAASEVRDLAIVWAIGNGVAIVCVAAALVLLVSWRTRLLDSATAGEAISTEQDGHPAAGRGPNGDSRTATV